VNCVNCDTGPLTSTHVCTVQQSLCDNLKEFSIPDLQPLLSVRRKKVNGFSDFVTCLMVID
jgi:hypothetical protein